MILQEKTIFEEKRKKSLENNKSIRKVVNKEFRKEIKKLEELIDKSRKIILEISNVFPFDLFTDKIIIDLNKVNIIQRELFSSGRTHSINIKDLGDVFVDTGAFFATLTIVDKGAEEKEKKIISIKYLRKDKALKASRIIQGLILVAKQGIDLTKMDMHDLVKKLEVLGSIEKGNS